MARRSTTRTGVRDRSSFSPMAGRSMRIAGKIRRCFWPSMATSHRHDRRGFGRSAQLGGGYDYGTFADNLATLFQALDLKDVALFGVSMGGGEVARYIGRHGTSTLSKAGLIAA